MSIPPTDFDQGCITLCEALQASDEFEVVKLLSSSYDRHLQISKRVNTPASTLPTNDGDRNEEHKEHEEHDDEALIRNNETDQHPLVIYDIIHSSSYQVPVLYLCLKQWPDGNRNMPSPEEVYQLLVPISQRPSMQAVGIMGALSLTDHPVNGMPAYFVHPCRTAEAMATVLSGREVKPVEYLMLWVGIIGSSVGLTIPTEIAMSLSASKDG